MILRQLIGIALFSLCIHTHAFVGGTDLSRLCAESDLIAVVSVPVVHSTNLVNIAEASIEQMIKGDPETKKVFFLATSTWTCDLSDARQGETALVFLNKIKDRTKVQTKWCKLPLQGYEPLYRIGHVGRGRMPIYEKDNVKYAEVWIGDVQIAHRIETFPSRRKPQYDFHGDVRLNEFIRLIEQEVVHPTIGYYAAQRATKLAKAKIQHFTVSGAVKSPGQFELRAGMTVHEAILLAGGFDREAERLTLRGGAVLYDVKPCRDFDLNYAPLLQNGDVIKVTKDSM